MNILFAAPEASPFAKTGGLGDVSAALPEALNEIGVTCSVIMPLYALVRKNGYSPKPFKSKIAFKLGARNLSFDLYSLKHKKTVFYFVKKDDLYDREALYQTAKGDYPDNALRYGFFSAAVLASVPYIGKVDVINCCEWHTGLIPLYLKTVFKNGPALENIKVLFSIHNLAYQGLFGREVMPALGIPESLFTSDGIEFYGRVNFIKSGIVFSDAINTVSEGYAREMLTKEFGCGLEDYLLARRGVLYGILNGADYSVWNPETDKFIAKNYGAFDLAGKLECKKDLLREFRIPFDSDTPLIGIVTRLAEQKGIDLVVEAMGDILALGANVVILGTGDEKYNKLVEDMAKRYKGRAGAKVAFDERLAHKIEAGSDMFLMPSRYEPCGLNQMYSLKYATVPIVRATGGLEDTVWDFDPETNSGNGFKFKAANAADMLEAIERAAEAFKDKKIWAHLMKNGLLCDFSWEASARRYSGLYKKILEKNSWKNQSR